MSFLRTTLKLFGEERDYHGYHDAEMFLMRVCFRGWCYGCLFGEGFEPGRGEGVFSVSLLLTVYGRTAASMLGPPLALATGTELRLSARLRRRGGRPSAPRSARWRAGSRTRATPPTT